MELSTRASSVVPAPAGRVWSVLVDVERLAELLRPTFPVPGVVRAEVEGGGALAVGCTRVVHLSDGAIGRERIHVLDAPSHHVYDLTGLAPPSGWLVTKGVADWRLTAIDGGTEVAWTYTFTLSSPLAWPLARLALPAFARFMRAGLASLRRLSA